MYVDSAAPCKGRRNDLYLEVCFAARASPGMAFMGVANMAMTSMEMRLIVDFETGRRKRRNQLFPNAESDRAGFTGHGGLLYWVLLGARPRQTKREVGRHQLASMRLDYHTRSTMSAARSQFWQETGPRIALRRCEAQGCACEAEFRAPKSRDRLRDYYWFCLEHVREYNRSWDYYAGMAAEEIEAHVRSDTTWNCPTWRLGDRSATIGRGDRTYRVHDPFDLFGEEAGPAPNASQPAPKPRGLSTEEKALILFDLVAPVTLQGVKKRYKELVKRHHPDANGGDKDAEERLKLINEAYATLRQSLTV